MRYEQADGIVVDGRERLLAARGDEVRQIEAEIRTAVDRIAPPEACY